MSGDEAVIHNMMMLKALQVEFTHIIIYIYKLSRAQKQFVLSTKAVCFLDMICHNAVDQIGFKKGF